MTDDYDDYDDYERECFQCGGEGFYASCFEEWACMYPDEGCDLCTRRCDVCNPRKLTPEDEKARDELRAALATALKDQGHD